MKSLAVFISIILFTASTAWAGPLPPLAAGQGYMVFPPGSCTGIIELGTYKTEINQIWTRSPRVFIETCSVMPIALTFARNNMAVRCVDRTAKTPLSSWVRSSSALSGPWPAECQQWTVGVPMLGTPP